MIEEFRRSNCCGTDVTIKDNIRGGEIVGTFYICNNCGFVCDVDYNESRETEENDEYKLSYNNDSITKDKLYKALLTFFTEQEKYSGESICQSDSAQSDGIELLSDIADDIFKFKVKYKE